MSDSSLAVTPEVAWKAREQAPYAFCFVAGVKTDEHHQVPAVTVTVSFTEREGLSTAQTCPCRAIAPPSGKAQDELGKYQIVQSWGEDMNTLL